LAALPLLGDDDHRDDLTATVGTAGTADRVGEFVGIAVGADAAILASELAVRRTTGAGTLLRESTLRLGHDTNLMMEP
jgi:hypothetical protein